MQLISFYSGGEEYGMEILKVREIIRFKEITKIPEMPSFIEGIINLRGSIIPVINLRKRLGLPVKEFDKDTRIIVIDIDNNVVGLIVDKINKVIKIDEEILEDTPGMVEGKKSKYIDSIAKMENSLLLILNPDKILSDSQKEALAELDENVEV